MHYEAGVKSTLLDGAMQFAVSAFYTEYDDYQDAAFVGQVVQCHATPRRPS